ncbi:MAG: methyltransferase [Pseudomonadota bacterium]
MTQNTAISVLNKRLTLNHLPNGFKTSMDSVLLASACPIQPKQSLLDLGCGVGGAGLCVLARVPEVELTGIDIQADQIDLAEENAAGNNFAEKCEFLCSDIREYKNQYAFDHVIMNPPYLNKGAHLKSPHPEKSAAMGHDDATLEEWMKTAHYSLKSKGSLTIIHRADQIDHVLALLDKKFGATEIIPLWPKQGTAAKRVIIRTFKDRYSPATLHAGLTLHDEEGDYTIETNRILKDIGGLYL